MHNLATLRCHTLNQILIKYDEKRYLSQLYQNHLILCSMNLLKCFSSFVTMATCWAPGVPNIKAFPGLL